MNRRLSAKLEKRIRGVFHAKSAMAEPPVDPINAISSYAQPDNMVLLSFQNEMRLVALTSTQYNTVDRLKHRGPLLGETIPPL